MCLVLVATHEACRRPVLCCAQAAHKYNVKQWNYIAMYYVPFNQSNRIKPGIRMHVQHS